MRTLFIPVVNPRNPGGPMIHLRKQVDDSGAPVRIDLVGATVKTTDDLALEVIGALRGLPKVAPAPAPSLAAVVARGARERRQRIVAAWRREQDETWANTQTRNAAIWKMARRRAGVPLSAIEQFSS